MSLRTGEQRALPAPGGALPLTPRASLAALWKDPTRMQTRTGEELGAGRWVILGIGLALGIVFWHSPLLWPLKVLVVMIHETGHAVATLLVGGSVDRVVISANESGHCLSRIPLSKFGQIAVYSAGYVGSALAASVLLLATLRFRLRRPILVAAAIWLVVMAVLYGGSLFTVIFCVGTALALAAAARWLPSTGVEILNLFLAGFCALYALVDLRLDLWSSEVRARSDAALLAELTWIPALVWAAIWTVLSVALVGTALRLSIIRRKPQRVPARR